MIITMAVSKSKGPHFGSPYNEEHSIFGSILGPPVYGTPHMIIITTLSLPYIKPKGTQNSFKGDPKAHKTPKTKLIISSPCDTWPYVPFKESFEGILRAQRGFPNSRRSSGLASGCSAPSRKARGVPRSLRARSPEVQRLLSRTHPEAGM